MTKVSIYFQLKCATPCFEQSANAVYKLFCQCDMALFCDGYTACHLVTRAREHFNFTPLQNQ